MCHPLVGQMSRRLVWQFSERERAGLGVFRDGRLLDVNDQPIDWLSSSSTVRLWHPLGDPPELVLAWRSSLSRNAVVQPFKQAHREIYILTEAERITGVYSNRFAAHVLRQHQFAALCRERGWQYRLQGDWDSANTPVRRLPRWGLEIEFWLEIPADRSGLGHSGCFSSSARIRSGSVGTVRQSDWRTSRLSRSPKRCATSICSWAYAASATIRHGRIAAPAVWRYWRNYSFGELSETARTRRPVLEALIPKLGIADRLSLEERFLVVRGDLKTYKIHLGSGNVLMEPGSQYLCIVPDRTRSKVRLRDVWLPFEGDRGLSIILSKALMLAGDTKITDPIIVQQIRRS